LTIIRKKEDSDDLAVFNDEIAGESEFAEDNVLGLCCALVESAADLASGGVSVGVEDAITRVSAFACEGKLGSGAVELCAPLNQFFNALWPFLYEYASGFDVAESGAGGECVLEMETYAIFVGKRGGYPALGILRIRF
jgi:hypothetical protein